MTERMTAAELRAARTKGKRRDLEGPIHLSIRELLELLGLTFHHSPNELDMAGKSAMLAVAKAKAYGMRPGWPDFEIVYGGRAYFLEVKAPGGTLSPDQKNVHHDLRAAGVECEVVTSVDQAHNALIEWGIA